MSRKKNISTVSLQAVDREVLERVIEFFETENKPARCIDLLRPIDVSGGGVTLREGRTNESLKRLLAFELIALVEGDGGNSRYYKAVPEALKKFKAAGTKNEDAQTDLSSEQKQALLQINEKFGERVFTVAGYKALNTEQRATSSVHDLLNILAGMGFLVKSTTQSRRTKGFCYLLTISGKEAAARYKLEQKQTC